MPIPTQLTIRPYQESDAEALHTQFWHQRMGFETVSEGRSRSVQLFTNYVMERLA